MSLYLIVILSHGNTVKHNGNNVIMNVYDVITIMFIRVIVLWSYSHNSIASRHVENMFLKGIYI